MTPEKEARVLIDQHLRDAGWIVQDASAINLSEGLGIAVREFPLKTGFADYLLYADGKAIGVVEAKPEGFPLKGVETQSSKYTFGLPKDLPHYHLPLPPLAEQEQIVALVEERLSQIDSAEKTIDAELIRSKRLRQSILKRAFEGNLVPQDPKDEPASVLLERIKASREAEQPKKKAKKVKAKNEQRL